MKNKSVSGSDYESEFRHHNILLYIMKTLQHWPQTDLSCNDSVEMLYNRIEIISLYLINFAALTLLLSRIESTLN